MKNIFIENWSTQVRKGLLDYAIMRTLISGERYGYEIVRLLDGHPQLAIKEGIIYPILSKLKKSGLVVSELKDVGVGPARRYYSLTKIGRETLTEMDDYWEKLIVSIKYLGES